MVAALVLGSALLALAFFLSRQGLLKAPLMLAAILVASVSVAAPMASAAKVKPVKQMTLRLKASSHSAHAGTGIHVSTTGGSGSGPVRFTTTGLGCSIGQASGMLRASMPTTCVVKATKGASLRYQATVSATMTFTFTSIPVSGPDQPSYNTPDKATLVTTSWSSTGLKGSGPVNDTVNGFNWYIDAYYSPTDHWYYGYLSPGATVTLTWMVTGSYGQPLANTTVTLETQFAPGANNGKGDLDATFTSPTMNAGNIVTTTDAKGMATFTFTSTTLAAPPAPAGWNSSAISTAPLSNSAPSTTVADVAAEVLEAGSGYAWTRMVLQVAGDTFSHNPALPTVNQATDLVDLIVVGTGA